MKESYLIALAVPLAFLSSTCRDRAGDASEPSPGSSAPTKVVTLEPDEASPPSMAEPASDPVPRAKTWTFDDERTGRIPHGFTAATGEWRWVADDTSSASGNVLAQHASSAGAIFNIVLVDDTHYSDVDISVRLKAVAGRIDQGGGVVWRAADARNYYIARYNPLEDNYRVYFVENGRRRMLDSATVRIDHQAWHTLRVTMTGDHIRGYIDGTEHLDVRDTTFTAAGQIGLWTKADARTHFDDLEVRAPATAPDAEAASK